MYFRADFFRSVVDSVTDHIAVIDKSGQIRFVNSAWIKFGVDNECRSIMNWEGINYLTVCDSSAANGEDFGRIAGEGIRGLIEKQSDCFYFEYPCHSVTIKRWFMMRVTPMQWDEQPHYIISHHNITERKLAEEKLRELSNTDELTGLANRRQYNISLNLEWRRSIRSRQPLSLIMLDIDHFKQFNDNYGHLAGDECLRKIGRLLMSSISRAGDLAARYGGEEFAAVLSNCSQEQAKAMADKILVAVQQLQIPHGFSLTSDVLTVSIGAATIYPDNNADERLLEAEADRLMYVSKIRGRNQVSIASEA